MSAAQADRICGALLAALEGSLLPAALHSRFRGTANLSTPLGLVTLLSPERSLQPYAAVLTELFEFGRLEAGALTLDSLGLALDGAVFVSFRGATPLDLALPSGPIPPPGAARSLRRFLSAAPGDGLARMALGQNDGPYAALLAPRLDALRRAVLAGDTALAATVARGMAGCGPGLTPSSDDLLCGYLALMPNRGLWTGMAPAIALAAAEGTNDISAALLTRAGAGYFSEDVLALIACLRVGIDGPQLHSALLRVASFGESSGRDFLTGAYFGVLDACAIGGIPIDSIRGT